MLGSASTIGAFSLARWTGLPAARAHCVGHFLGLAATLAAAKVLLSTIGVAAFVAEQGAAGLPSFYVGFAPVAILLSFGLSGVIDRAPKARLAQVTFAVLLIGTAALRLLLALEVPGLSFALLASATAFEIILDIVFWLVVAAYLDAFELKRATPLVYMALALGGAAGGALALLGANALLPADLLLLLLPLAGLIVVQFGAVANQLREVPDDHPEGAGEAAAGLGLVPLGRLLKRYPLALLIALNALVVTLLYGLAEFLILRIYEARFETEAELVQFLSLLFALVQIVEFGLLYTLTRALLERTGPLVRNLVFPLTSLGSLVFLVLNPKLSAAVLMHVNIEAACNALFLPVNSVNYVPLPLGLQGRARTLSEGIFYPTGLALAGAVLWTADPDTALLQAEFAALVFVALFMLLSTGAGLLFLPTLSSNITSALVRPAGAISVPPHRPAAAVPQVRALLQSREVELRLHGLAQAQRIAPAALEDELLALTARPDRPTRLALARLVTAAPERWRDSYLDRCMDEENAAAQKLALLVMLMARVPLKPDQTARVLDARDPAVRVLGHVVLAGVHAQRPIEPLLQRPEVASQLVDAIVAAGRIDCAPLLLACLARAGPEQQHRALVMLEGTGGPPGAAAAAVVRSLARHRNPALRAAAIGFLSRSEPWQHAVAELVAALDDPDHRVRRGAADALCRHGDAAVALLRPQLSAVGPSGADAVLALARIGSPAARRLLQGYLCDLQQDARRTAQLLQWTRASRDRERWAAVEVCLHEHKAQTIDVLLAALAPALDGRPGGHLGEALKGADQRGRAKAFEVIATARTARLAPGALPGLRSLLFGDEAGAGRSAGPGTGDDVALDQARASMSPWVRRAAAQVAARAGSPPPVLRPASVAGPAREDPGGAWEIVMDDLDFERIVALKRTPLFRGVPLETLVLVARAVEARVYLAGEEVIAAGSGGRDLLVLEAGALSVMHPEGTETVPAPACFGEVALAGERMLWPRIKAARDARVSFLRAALFEELCRERPELAIALCRCLARRLREAAEGPRRLHSRADWPVAAAAIADEPDGG